MNKIDQFSKFGLFIILESQIVAYIKVGVTKVIHWGLVNGPRPLPDIEYVLPYSLLGQNDQLQ